MQHLRADFPVAAGNPELPHGPERSQRGLTCPPVVLCGVRTAVATNLVGLFPSVFSRENHSESPIHTKPFAFLQVSKKQGLEIARRNE